MSSRTDLPKCSSPGTQHSCSSVALSQSLVLGAGACVHRTSRVGEGLESSSRRVRTLVGYPDGARPQPLWHRWEQAQGALSLGELGRGCCPLPAGGSGGRPGRTWEHQREGAGLDPPAAGSRERAEVCYEETPSELRRVGAAGPWVRHFTSLSPDVTVLTVQPWQTSPRLGIPLSPRLWLWSTVPEQAAALM